MLTTAVLSGAGFLAQSSGLVPVAGLLQRISILTGLAWLTTLLARVLRDEAATARHGSLRLPWAYGATAAFRVRYSNRRVSPPRAAAPATATAMSHGVKSAGERRR